MFLNYKQYQLFLCNYEFMKSFYKIFNCTPFLTNDDTIIPECAFIYIPLIKDIFEKLKNFTFKCNFIDNGLKPMDIKRTVTSEYWEGWAFDLNSVKVYRDVSIQEYELIKFIVNISNLWNITIGCSFLTLIEFLFLFYKHFSKHNNVSE